MDNLEFITDKASWGKIEEQIVDYYDLGYADSSNFMYLSNGINSSLCIQATKGSIEFSAIVGENKDGNYNITIMPKKIKRNK